METIRRPSAVPNLLATCCVVIGSILVRIFSCGTFSYLLSHCLAQQLFDCKFRGAELFSHARSGLSYHKKVW